MDTPGPLVLSVVVPMYDEEQVLPLFVERVRPVLDALGEPYELVAVDDGSRDGTPVLLQAARRTWPQLRVLHLRANSGHQAAISAGLAAARGDWVVTLDADLQDPPEVIPEMLAAARRDGADVVYGVRADRSSDSTFKRGTAHAYYALMRRLGASGAPDNAGDYRLMSRATVDAVNALPEEHRVLRLLVPALGFPSTSVPYTREVRAGFLVAVGLFLYALVAKATGHAIAGWTSTVVIVSAFGAVQLLCLGILGEYVGRIYVTLQRRPTYYVAHDSLTASEQVDEPTGSATPRAADRAPAAGRG